MTICVDPPWPVTMIGKYKRRRHSRADALPYSTMTVKEIRSLDVDSLADRDSHLWLWSTWGFFRDAQDMMEHWGFKFHTVVTWVKPSGFGNYLISRTQPLLFGYKGKMRMNERYKPNVLFAPNRRHSQKPECSYELIEQVSFGPRLELFGRRLRSGWTVLGNEIDGLDIRDAIANLIQGC